MRKKDWTSNKLFCGSYGMRKLRGFEPSDEIKVNPKQIFSNEIVQLVETIKYFLPRKLVQSGTLIKR